MLSFMVGTTVFLVIAGGYFLLAGGGNRKRAERVQRALTAAAGEAVLDTSILRETQSDLSSMLSDVAARYPLLRRIELSLYQAGQPLSLQNLLGLVAGLTIGGALVGLAFGLTPAPGLLGLAPLVVVGHLKKKRMKIFDDTFPQALALFSRALRAGHSLSSAFQMVGSEMSDPVGPEFAIVAREIALGQPPGTALANLQDRLDTSDLPVFVTAVLVQLETGGNLAEILDNLGSTVRDRILFDGKVKALTAQSRISANILVAVPFTIVGLMSVFNPEFVDPLLNTPSGHMMLGAGAVMVIFGWLACRFVAKVEV
jgi:tight adherence protein B